MIHLKLSFPCENAKSLIEKLFIYDNFRIDNVVLNIVKNKDKQKSQFEIYGIGCKKTVISCKCENICKQVLQPWTHITV